MDDERLDNLLSHRYAPSAPGGLAERIITAAYVSMGAPPVRRSWRQEIRNFFLVPQPALVFAACLFVGLYLGLQVESFAAMSTVEWGSFMKVDEVWI